MIKEGLGTILGGNAEKEAALLSLVGIKPSEILGCTVQGSEKGLSFMPLNMQVESPEEETDVRFCHLHWKMYRNCVHLQEEK